MLLVLTWWSGVPVVVGQAPAVPVVLLAGLHLRNSPALDLTLLLQVGGLRCRVERETDPSPARV
jgi:hypothetical protein